MRHCNTASVWVSDDGRLNTVALPEPSETMTEAFRRSLEALVRVDPDALDDVIDEAEDTALSRDWSDLDASDQFVGAAPPIEILRGELKSASDLALAIEHVDPRWQLDAVLALSDYLNQD